MSVAIEFERVLTEASAINLYYDNLRKAFTDVLEEHGVTLPCEQFINTNAIIDSWDKFPPDSQENYRNYVTWKSMVQ